MVRDINAGRFTGNDSLVLLTHGLSLRIFLMRWFHWTVDEFLNVFNPPNCQPLVRRPRLQLLCVCAAVLGAASATCCALGTSADLSLELMYYGTCATAAHDYVAQHTTQQQRVALPAPTSNWPLRCESRK